MINTTVLSGRLVSNPELKTTAKGVSVCTIRIAVGRKYVKTGEERKTDFFDVVAWKYHAEFINRYCIKGSMIIVQGQLQNREYTTKDGSKRVVTELIAENVQLCDYKSSASGDKTPVIPDANNPGFGTTETVGDNNMMESSGFIETPYTEEDLPF